MEAKKSSKANLENKRATFFQIGLAITLLLVLFAFEWKSPESESNNLINTNTSPLIPTDYVPITIQPENTPPPKIMVPIFSDQFEIVDNGKLVTDSFFFPEDNTKDPIEYYTPIITPEVIPIDDEIPFHIVEKAPQFQESEDLAVFSKWVFSNLVYPESAKETNLQGRITVGFTIDAEGNVTNVKVLRGIHASLDDEVVRVISSSPKWTPGKQRDRNVKVSYTFPVVFELR